MNFPDLLFFAVLALLIFGPKRLPEIARTVGKTMTELRRASNEFRQSLEEEFHNLEEPLDKPSAIDLTPDFTEPYNDKAEAEPDAEPLDEAGHELPPWEADLEEENFDDPEVDDSGWMAEDHESGDHPAEIAAADSPGLPESPAAAATSGAKTAPADVAEKTAAPPHLTENEPQPMIPAKSEDHR